MYKKALIILLLIMFTSTVTFSIPKENDFFLIKKIYTLSINSLNAILIFSTPLFPDGGFSDQVYNYYSTYCHQLPGRSFFINDKQLPVCARCTGMTIGYLLGEFGYMIWEDNNPYNDFSLTKSIIYCFVLSLFTLPLILDGGIQYLTDYESNNTLRLTTGILFGISVTSIVDEVVRVIDYYL